MSFNDSSLEPKSPKTSMNRIFFLQLVLARENDESWKQRNEITLDVAIINLLIDINRHYVKH